MPDGSVESVLRASVGSDGKGQFIVPQYRLDEFQLRTLQTAIAMALADFGKKPQSAPVQAQGEFDVSIHGADPAAQDTKNPQNNGAL